MYTALFVLGIAIFGYLMYVLVKPEKIFKVTHTFKVKSI